MVVIYIHIIYSILRFGLQPVKIRNHYYCNHLAYLLHIQQRNIQQQNYCDDKTQFANVK